MRRRTVTSLYKQRACYIQEKRIQIRGNATSADWTNTTPSCYENLHSWLSERKEEYLTQCEKYLWMQTKSIKKNSTGSSTVFLTMWYFLGSNEGPGKMRPSVEMWPGYSTTSKLNLLTPNLLRRTLQKEGHSEGMVAICSNQLSVVLCQTKHLHSSLHLPVVSAVTHWS